MSVTYLEKRHPDENQMRFYAITVTPTLFGPWSLIREWGRIGQPGTVREVWFDSKTTAEESRKRLLRQKQRRGYQIVGLRIEAATLTERAAHVDELRAVLETLQAQQGGADGTGKTRTAPKRWTKPEG